MAHIKAVLAVLRKGSERAERTSASRQGQPNLWARWHFRGPINYETPEAEMSDRHCVAQGTL